MTQATHTLGPWQATEGGNVRTVAEPGWLVATVASTFRKQGNARLIAAAPELLAALERLLHQVEYMGAPDDHEDIIEARAAIAKAKGE